jgi:hypothetical protein
MGADDKLRIPSCKGEDVVNRDTAKIIIFPQLRTKAQPSCAPAAGPLHYPATLEVLRTKVGDMLTKIVPR